MGEECKGEGFFFSFLAGRIQEGLLGEVAFELSTGIWYRVNRIWSAEGLIMEGSELKLWSIRIFIKKNEW